MFLQGILKSQILNELKKHFTNEELDSVDTEKMEELIAESENLEDLIDAIDDFLADDE